MTSNETIQVAAGIIRDGDRLLITQRFDDAHLGDLWEFPGGKVEEGETPEETLSREIKEELGVEVRVGELYLETTHAYPDRRVHLSFFECRIASGEPRCLHVARTAWARPFELDRFAFPEANAALVDKLMTE